MSKIDDMKSFLSKLIKTPATPVKSDEVEHDIDSSSIINNINSNNKINNNNQLDNEDDDDEIKGALNSSVISNKSINDSDNDWIKPKNHSSSTSATKQSNKRLYHITSFEDVNTKRIELSKIVWAKHPSIGKLNETKSGKLKNLFPGRICENGIRTLNTNTQVVIEFFNLPYTFSESSTKCVVDIKNIRSFNCPFISDNKECSNMLDHPNMWTIYEDNLRWDIPTMDNLLAVGYTVVYILYLYYNIFYLLLNYVYLYELRCYSI